MKEFYLCTQTLGAPLKGDGCVQMKSNLKHNACHEIVTRREEEVQRNVILIFKIKLYFLSDRLGSTERSESLALLRSLIKKLCFVVTYHL